MIDQPFSELVGSLAAKTSTPGGGAAAALAGCMGAALLLMVVRFSRGKKGNEARDGELATAEQQLQRHLEDLMPMAQRDCAAFDAVAAAFKLPKDDDQQKAQRSASIQQAMVGAMEVPAETMVMVRDVYAAMAPVTDCVGANIASDMLSGGALLQAAAESAFLNVRINAQSLQDKDRAAAALQDAAAVLAEVRSRQAAIAGLVDGLLG